MFAVFEDLFRQVNALNELVKEDKGTEPLLVRFVPFTESAVLDYETIYNHLCDIEDRLFSYGFPRMRQMFIEDILRALKMQCREGMGDDIDFTERVEAYVGVPGEPVSDEELNFWKNDLDERLSQEGYKGDLDEKLERWRENNAIPKDEFPSIAENLMQDALKLTRCEVIDLPDGVDVKFEPVTDVFYGGYSEATGPYTSQITLNADLRWVWPQLKNVVAHESFPGHSALNALRSEQAMLGILPPEACFYLANTPITPIIEGTCNLGVRFLHWNEGADFEIGYSASMYEQAKVNRRLFAYHAEGVSKEEIIRSMMRQDNMTEVEAETKFRFLSDPLWCTSMPHYYHGTRLTTKAWHKYEEDDNLDELKKIVFEEIHTFRTFKYRTGLTDY